MSWLILNIYQVLNAALKFICAKNLKPDLPSRFFKNVHLNLTHCIHNDLNFNSFMMEAVII